MTTTFLKQHSGTMMRSRFRYISTTIKSSYDNYYGSSSSSSSTHYRYASKTIDSNSKEQQQFTYISRKGDRVGHMVGSSTEKALRKGDKHVKKFRSFTAQWIEETNSPWPLKCSTKGCSNEPTVGAHVFIRNKEFAYLVPMCQRCNMLGRNNFVPHGFPDQLDNGIPCVELTHLHISKQTYINLDRSTWLEMLERFTAYSKKYDSPLVPSKYKPDRQLGSWVTIQRKNYKRDGLTLRQIELLEANGFVWDVFGYRWDENIKLLLKYKQREGHCNVPYDHKEDGENIGFWLTNQRNGKKNGKLDNVKEKQLEELGVIWEPISDRWDENIRLLVQYKQREGHCNVPYDHKEGGENIGFWLSNQRNGKKNGKLDNVKEKQLEELGVIWEPISDRWDENIRLLVQYKQREGHCNVPYDHEEDGKALGTWLYNQRHNKRNGKLDNVKEKQLEELGVIWEPISDRWDENIRLLVQYKQREGHCNVPSNHKEGGENIGFWLTNQRNGKKNGKLDNVKEKQLEELGVIWEPISDRWDENIRLLVQYKQREGHCNVPYNHEEDGKTLGTWLYNQRHNKRNGKLSEDRQHRLEEIGAIWDEPMN